MKPLAEPFNPLYNLMDSLKSRFHLWNKRAMMLFNFWSKQSTEEPIFQSKSSPSWMTQQELWCHVHGGNQNAELDSSLAQAPTLATLKMSKKFRHLFPNQRRTTTWSSIRSGAPSGTTGSWSSSGMKDKKISFFWYFLYFSFVFIAGQSGTETWTACLWTPTNRPSRRWSAGCTWASWSGWWWWTWWRRDWCSMVTKTPNLSEHQDHFQQNISQRLRPILSENLIDAEASSHNWEWRIFALTTCLLLDTSASVSPEGNDWNRIYGILIGWHK